MQEGHKTAAPPRVTDGVETDGIWLGSEMNDPLFVQDFSSTLWGPDWGTWGRVRGPDLALHTAHITKGFRVTNETPPQPPLH